MSSGALDGDLTAHRVDTYPLVNENSIILITLNQSALSPNSQDGATLNAIKKNVPTNNILAYDII